MTDGIVQREIESLARDNPIDMVLHCPACGMQHIDAPEPIRMAPPEFGYMSVLGSTIQGELNPFRWKNPPHRSHLCGSCGHIWRPADVPTNGVAAIKTKGKNDSPVSAAAESETESKRMFVARLENMREQGHTWMTIPAVLALLNDCDMLASR